MQINQKGKNTISIQPNQQLDIDDDTPFFEGQKKETPSEEFLRQRNIADEACQLGRKILAEKDYLNASKQFSKAVMTFEYILKNNPKMMHLKEEISQMVKTIIQPAYSNLSLCFLKLENWGMVINFANQVIQNDSSNIKNIYRRGVARKMTKAFDQAIQDFQKVITLDQEMKGQCLGQINECRQLKKEQKRKSKELAKQFIQGYSANKPDPKIVAQEQKTERVGGDSLWSRGWRCLTSICPKWLGGK